MPNRCVICGRKKREGAATFTFPKDDYIKSKWINFVNNRPESWKCTQYSRLCEDHFDENDLIRHRKKVLLASPLVIPTKRTEDEETTIPPSLLPIIEPPRKAPRIRGILPDQINQWRDIDQIQTFENITAEKCPSEFILKLLNFKFCCLYFIVYIFLALNKGQITSTKCTRS